ncbi:LysR family transcriptional regulator [Streptomyces sp. NPDC093094]|uniref:LysR family transcriptional regulator n=1 Tax=Streptomyces sp. NPDC093094 TaxID=3366026 RepID=UPI0037F8F9E3
MELELRHLRTIRTIAEAGSLTRAASVLGLAQPALSAQLRRIERTLGGALFERGRYGVRATALGELVLERTRIVLPAVSELQREATRFARDRRAAERLRLGGTHGPLLGALVDRLADAAPDATVTTCASWSERELAELLAEGRLDFALAGTCGSASPPGAPQLVWQEIAVDPVFVMLGEEHPLARGSGELELAALAGQEWACVPGDGCFADCFTAACARAGFTPRRMYETDTASCVHLVQVGRAVGLCRATFPPTPGITTRPLAETPLVWRHLLGWHPTTQQPDTAATVLAQARGAHAVAAARSGSYADWLARRGRARTRSITPGQGAV